MNLGYLGGITLAVMVGRVCQDHPDLMPSCLLYKFFDIYAESNWQEPIQMRFFSNQKDNSYKAIRPELLDAINRYSNDLLVVLTPNDQLKNTAYRVSSHTFDTICYELRCGKTRL